MFRGLQFLKVGQNYLKMARYSNDRIKLTQD